MIGPVVPTAVQVIEASTTPLVLNLIVPGKQGPPGVGNIALTVGLVIALGRR